MILVIWFTSSILVWEKGVYTVTELWVLDIYNQSNVPFPVNSNLYLNSNDHSNVIY